MSVLKFAIIILVIPAALASAQTAGTALVRHGSTLNGTVEGSVQVMTAENVTLNGGARVTGDLLVPGTQTVRLDGNPVYGGTLDGTGAATPTNHQVTLNGNASLRHVIRRTDAVALPAANAPLPSAGTRDLTVTSAGQAVAWPAVRDLTVQSRAGLVPVPPGRYRTVTVRGGAGLVLGVAGSATPAVYHLRSLRFNGDDGGDDDDDDDGDGDADDDGGSSARPRIEVVGPVLIYLGSGLKARGEIGSAARPDWLRLELAAGGLALKGGASVHAYVTAPAGTVTLNGHTRLVGGVISDRLAVNGHGLLRLQAPPLTLPFLAGFEAAQGYTLGAIHGQQSWTASSSSVVTDADFATGARSALVPAATPPLTLSHAFDPHPGQGVVFVDLFTLPQAAATEAASAQLSTLDTAALAFVRDGATGRVSALHGNGAGGGAWQRLAPSIAIDAQGYAADWLRLTTRLDYTARRWDLYINGALAAYDLGFLQNTPSNLGSFSLTGQAAGHTLLDDFLAAFDNPVFADADQDGMADAWETAHGLNPALNDRNADPDADTLPNILEFMLGTNPASADTDGDGMPDGWEKAHNLNPLLGTDAALDPDGDGVSNLQEYLNGTDPADYYNGVPPVVTSLMPSDGSLLEGAYLAFRVTNSAGAPWVNAPITFAARGSEHGYSPTKADRWSKAKRTVTVRTDANGIARAYVVRTDELEAPLP